MKVCYFYRTRGISFSIERVFKQIRRSMPTSIEQSEFFCPKNSYKNPLTYVENMLGAKRIESDIFHITGVVHYLAEVFPPERTVITVHDLGHIFGTKGLVGVAMRQIFAKLPLKRAKHIVAISESSRKEIAEKVGIDAKNIEVIYDPAPEDFKLSRKEINLEKPRILCFCHMANKNLERHIMSLQGISCHLRIIGNLNDSNKKLLADSGTDYSNASNLSNEQILEEYAKSDIVLFASTYEGFGVPILEGQLTGRPVVTSAIPPMTEVSNGSAVEVDPLDIKSIRDGILKIINSRDFTENLIGMGLENVKRFSAKRIAKQYSDIYEKAAK